MFLVMIRVTSCSSSLSLSNEFPAALAVRVSWYNRVVFDMKVSATRSARLYGRKSWKSEVQALTEPHKRVRLPYAVHLGAIRSLELF